MQAMVLQRIGEPLTLVERRDPEPAEGEVRVRISACGVCRTDLHVVDGELPNIRLPIVPGHEIVGRVEAVGSEVRGLTAGMRVGVPWLARTCGTCRYCVEQRENLCERPQFTGYTRDGGYATHMVADAGFVFRLPDNGDDQATAPLLCAGLIGWRALRMAGEGRRLGLYGFGRPTSSPRWRAGKAARCSPSLGSAMLRARTLRGSSAPSGPAPPK